MKKRHLLIAGVVLLVALFALLFVFRQELRQLAFLQGSQRVPFGELKKSTELLADYSWSPQKRVREARRAKLEGIKALFADRKVRFPPARLFFRVFKQEMELEVWAASQRDERLAHIVTYEVCAIAGKLGPKRREGDSQTPEGFYHVNRFNPASSYYLSMQVSYPNASDRILKTGPNPGSAIMIHGECVSVGCVAIGDNIKELWTMADLSRRRAGRIVVHLFPSKRIADLIEKTRDAELEGFWANLKQGFDYFEEQRMLPLVTVASSGKYRFE